MRLRFHTCCHHQPFSKLRLRWAPPSLLGIFIFPPLPELIPLSFNSVIAEQESARARLIVLSHGLVHRRKLSRKCKWALFKGIFHSFWSPFVHKLLFHTHTLMHADRRPFLCSGAARRELSKHGRWMRTASCVSPFPRSLIKQAKMWADWGDRVCSQVLRNSPV